MLEGVGTEKQSQSLVGLIGSGPKLLSSIERKVARGTVFIAICLQSMPASSNSSKGPSPKPYPLTLVYKDLPSEYAEFEV